MEELCKKYPALRLPVEYVKLSRDILNDGETVIS